MAEINPDALRLVKAAWERYQEQVEASRLQPSAKRTYLLHSKNFVRWLEGDFTPGGTL
ncbi:MAG: hypothetical protein Q7K03_01400 [Dehalococcoidia bacterium]|nr:hypothetical protein [Dehalococcoidia bacterium]